MITKKNYNVDDADSSDTKLMYDFAKDKSFGLKAQGNKSFRDRTLIKLLKSPGLMVFCFGCFTNNVFTIRSQSIM